MSRKARGVAARRRRTSGAAPAGGFTPNHGWRRVATPAFLERSLATLLVVAAAALALSPTFADLERFGDHDWDQMASHRYLVVKSLLDFGELPFWNPYSCGGHPAWGYFEAATNLVSPFLPAYLLLPMALALRVEIVGTLAIAAIGAWVLARRLGAGPALCAFVACLFAINGRWAMQTAAGHTWFLYGCFAPWVVVLFDLAIDRDAASWRRLAAWIGAATVLALMVYTGAIYPLPHTVALLLVYALVLTAAQRSPRPLVVLGVTGVVALGLAAPKLLPILDTLRQFPRLITSGEVIDLATLVTMLTARGQDFGVPGPVAVPQHAWHEYGFYIGWIVIIAILGSAVAVRRAREVALLLVGGLFIMLSLGGGLWSWLHELPIFSSQHVPVRWMQLGFLALLLVAAATLERFLARARARWRWAGVVAVVAVAVPVIDVASEVRRPLRKAFTIDMPDAVHESLQPFRTHARLPAELRPSGWGNPPPSLMAMMANLGTIECYTFTGFQNYNYQRRRVIPRQGASGQGMGTYRGEIYVLDTGGVTPISPEVWTPNSVRVRVDRTGLGEGMLVFNKNWDPSWLVNGKPVLRHNDLVAVALEPGVATYELRYRPRLWHTGLAICGLTCLALTGAGLVWWSRGRAKRNGATGAERRT